MSLCHHYSLPPLVLTYCAAATSHRRAAATSHHWAAHLNLRPSHPPSCHSPSRRFSVGWAGGHGLTVRCDDGELTVLSESEKPPIVRICVMPRTQRNEVHQVRCPAIAPVLDVMRFGELISHATIRHRTRRIQRTQRPTLCTIRQTCRTAQVEIAIRIDHVAVVDRDLMHRCGPTQILYTRKRQVDRRPPVNGRSPGDITCSLVDDNNNFRSPEARRTAVRKRRPLQMRIIRR